MESFWRCGGGDSYFSLSRKVFARREKIVFLIAMMKGGWEVCREIIDLMRATWV